MLRLAALLFSLAFAASALAQTAGTVTAQGSASISVQPDQAQLTVGITTNGTTAQDAGQQNANATVALLGALQKTIGSNGKIETVSYSVSPRYSTGSPTQAPVIVGYSVTNTVQVTLTDLTLIGQVIDAANQAGATNVGNLNLGLQNPEPTLEAALAAAAKQALTHAGSIASGLGGKVGAVVSAQEAATYTPVAVLAGVASAGTPILPGPISVSATVTVTAQLQ